MKIFLPIVRRILYLWNPFPKKWKVGWADGKPVLDSRTRKKSREVTKAELARRKENKEELRKCFKLGPRGSADFRSKLG